MHVAYNYFSVKFDNGVEPLPSVLLFYLYFMYSIHYQMRKTENTVDSVMMMAVTLSSHIVMMIMRLKH